MIKRILTSLLLCSCSPAALTGVPNLHRVNASMWRSGQPITAAHWQHVKSLGVTDVLKLNFGSEGSDEGATRAGLQVHTFSIQPDEHVLDTLIEPDGHVVSQALALLSAPGRVWLVHCTHGWDRTGLLIGLVRHRYEGWSKAQAWDEMIRMGFHPYLYGLTKFWVEAP